MTRLRYCVGKVRLPGGKLRVVRITMLGQHGNEPRRIGRDGQVFFAEFDDPVLVGVMFGLGVLALGAILVVARARSARA